MPEQWVAFPLEAVRKLLRSSFAELRDYGDLTPQEKACVTEDEFVVLRQWVGGTRGVHRGRCTSCGSYLTLEVAL